MLAYKLGLLCIGVNRKGHYLRPASRQSFPGVVFRGLPLLDIFLWIYNKCRLFCNSSLAYRHRQTVMYFACPLYVYLLLLFSFANCVTVMTRNSQVGLMRLAISLALLVFNCHSANHTFAKSYFLPVFITFSHKHQLEREKNQGSSCK